jgi:hypothetical protein
VSRREGTERASLAISASIARYSGRAGTGLADLAFFSASSFDGGVIAGNSSALPKV